MIFFPLLSLYMLAFFLHLVLLHIGFDTLDNHIIGMVTIDISILYISCVRSIMQTLTSTGMRRESTGPFPRVTQILK